MSTNYTLISNALQQYIATHPETPFNLPALSLSVQRKYAIDDPALMYRGAVALCNTTPLPSGNFRVISLSRPSLSHSVNPVHESCTCEIGRTGQFCLHLVAWLLWREAHNAPQRDATAEREAQVKAERAARTRSEWYEEAF